MIIKHECPKCGDVVYKDQRFIVWCYDCNCQMNRSIDDGDQAINDDKK